VGDFAEYAEVVLQTQQYFQQVLGDTPCVAIGQSTGAAVLMSAAFILSKKAESAIFECLVFLGPLVRPRGFKLGRLVYSLLHRFIAQIKRDFNRPNSNDADFHLFLQFQDPLQARALSIQWLGAMFSWVEQFSSQPVINIPLLILQGTGDKVVDWEFNVSAIQEHFPQSQVSYVKGAKHHLANEAVPWRKVVFGGVTQFIRRAQINR
jgi:lysophospholipase